MSILGAVVVPHPPIILPEVGHGEEQKISATTAAYKEVSRRIVELAPDTIIITSPHSILYADYFHISPGEAATGNMAQFRAPQVALAINYDTEFVTKLSNSAMAAGVPAGTLGERNSSLDHGTMIPLRFLQEAGLDFNRVKFLRIGLSGMSAALHYKFGQTIARVADELGRKIFFIASGDLSHKLKSDGPYGFVEEGPQFDSQVMENLGGANFLQLLTMDNTMCNRAAECGLRSFWIMAGALDRKAIRAEKLSYEGTFGVGYGIVYFNIDGEDAGRNFAYQLAKFKKHEAEERKANEDAFVKLARHSLETFVKTRKPATLPADLPEELINRRAGAFVSLHKDGNLRGCIGTIIATQDNLAEEILQNAISACSKDPRFEPVTIDELDDIEYSVDVLGEPERIFDVKDLNVKRYGVIVENGARRGLLLPDLEGVDTVAEQIAIAKRKAGIRPEEKVALWRFEVIRHH
ncbi:MAG: AmmeMemoRadiSam system protein A [Selenomonadaceae bacterium]|nr:AmmeMemoRadiSam system protein A [Selenomonadaceae bacterium]MBQ7494076.1 AmmeMemoRadiSam system protein A [Selenomonadaceae bacterium]